MKRLAPVFAAILLLFALVFVKGNLDKAAPPEHEDEAAPASQPAPAAPSKEEGELPPEEFVGTTRAKYKITVGWMYDETNQPDPKKLQSALAAVKSLVAESEGRASLQIVNVDVPPEDRSEGARGVTDLGISVNGVRKPELSGNPGEGNLTAEKIGAAVMTNMGKM